MAEKINYATNIALVNTDNGIVKNVIWGMFYNTDEYSRQGYNAIPVHDLGVQIGDRYDSETSKFYDKSGAVVKSVVDIFTDEINELDEYIIDTIYNDIIDDIDAE